jgi:glycosyltransferase involved in cell wall biosynthesis
MDKATRLTLVLPFYNEEETIATFVETCLQVLSNQDEIILVNDGSTDGSLEICNHLVNSHSQKSEIAQLTCLHLQERTGRGASFVEGAKKVDSKFVGYMDTDFQHSPTDIKRAIHCLNNGFQIVSGWRIQRNLSIKRRFFSSAFQIISKILRPIPLEDPLSGFKFFTTDCLHKLLKKPTTNHWFFDFQILDRGIKQHQKVTEIPVLFVAAPKEHQSKTRLVKDSLVYLKHLLFTR